MTIKPLARFIRLQKPQGDEGANNGGGGRGTGAQSSNADDSGVGGSDDAGDSTVDPSDISDFNRYQRRIGGRTIRTDGTKGEEPKGALASSLAKSLGGEADEEGDDDNKEEDDNTEEEGGENGDAGNKQRKDDKKPKSKEESTEDDDETAIDFDALKTKQGIPVSESVKENIKKLQATARKWRTKAEELEKKSQSTDGSIDPVKYKEMETELTSLREKIEIEQFESSPAFIETYQAPLDKAKAELLKFMPKDIAQEEAAELSGLFQEAHMLAVKGEIADFHRTVDKITEAVLSDAGTSTKLAFAKRMDDYQEKILAWTEAMKDKGENRKKFVEKSLQEKRRKNVGSIESEMDSYVDNVLSAKADAIDSLPEAEREQYIQVVKKNATVVKNGLARMAVTGEIPKELNEIINKGVIADSITRDNQILVAGLKDSHRRLKMAEEEIAKLKGNRQKVSSQGRSGSYSAPPVRGQSTEKKNDRREGEGTLAYAARKAQEEAGV